LWLIKDVSIIVNLRKDIIFDINTNLIEGNYEITVPWTVSIGNIYTNVSNGNIFYDFEYSSIQGNITGITNNGDLELKSYDVEYTQNGNWLLISTGGYMNIEIYQYKEMGANITGTAIIGALNLKYIDNSFNIGALFTFPSSEWGGGLRHTIIRFVVNLLPPGPGFYLTSTDFHAKNNFELVFNIYTIEGFLKIVALNNYN